jgi:hypothetical protein
LIDYEVVLPGISVDDFMDNRHRLGRREYERKQVEYVFNQLSKEGLICPTANFRGKLRYSITDKELSHLVEDLNRFQYLQLRLFIIKWYYFERPSEKEENRIRFFWDDRSIKSNFQEADQTRTEFKRLEKILHSKPEFIELKRVLESRFNRLEREVENRVKELREKYRTTLQKYEFLHEIIERICPAILQEHFVYDK